ncbi:MAG: DUF3108 domain-containing protein [Caldilineaceae bacterium]
MLTLLLTACRTPEIQPLVPGPMPWADGEQSVYAVTDINGNYAGTTTITLNAGAATVEGDAWTLRREVATQGDQEVVVIEATAQGLRPLLSTLVRISGTVRQQVKATYTNGQVDMELTTASDVTTYERRNIPSDARDQRSLMLLLRSLPLAQDYATQINSYLPVADLLERVTIVVEDQESVDVPAGRYTCWRVALRIDDSESQAWIAVEDPHLLVKFVDDRNGGTFELRDYRATQE